MAGLKRLKRVSWAPEVSLRQVRFFLSEDAPALSGLGAQNNLQAKPSWLWHSAATDSDDNLPRGFEGPALHRHQKEIPQVPVIKWQCPYELVLNPNWLVVAGEESEEITVQSQRQLAVLEAIYPRPSSVPPNPSVSPDVRDSHCNDVGTPCVPLTAIEDEEPDPSSCSTPAVNSSLLEQPNASKTLAVYQTSTTLLPSVKLPVEQCQDSATAAIKIPPNGKAMFEFIPGAEPDIAAAASAAFTAMMRTSDKGSLIDRELLIKILSDPKMIDKLVSEFGNPNQVRRHMPPSSVFSLPVQIGHSAPLHSPSVPLVSDPFPSADKIPSKHPAEAGQLKDLNYYKSLIQQHGSTESAIHRHGREERETERIPLHLPDDRSHRQGGSHMDPWKQGPNPRDSRPRFSKRCIFFNSPMGCKHGASCSFLHDATSQWMDNKSQKRIKLDR